MIAWLYHGLRWTWGGYPISDPRAGYNIFSGPLADIFLVGMITHWIKNRRRDR